ncbi:MAG: hypothetical protein MO846_10450 [Candidatus Devosia symbiotica]|nr:hypothetical protein [Candidatus Devosia symbiotica]
MFPFLLPSSTVLNASLTLWDVSSSHLTMFIMLLATLIFLPIICFILPGCSGSCAVR